MCSWPCFPARKSPRPHAGCQELPCSQFPPVVLGGSSLCPQWASAPRVLWERPALQPFLTASSDVYCLFSFVTAPCFAALVSLSGCILANRSGGAGTCCCAGPKEMTANLWLMPALAATAGVGKALGRKTSTEKAGKEKASTSRQVWITETCQ